MSWFTHSALMLCAIKKAPCTHRGLEFYCIMPFNCVCSYSFLDIVKDLYLRYQPNTTPCICNSKVVIFYYD